MYRGTKLYNSLNENWSNELKKCHDKTTIIINMDIEGIPKSSLIINQYLKYLYIDNLFQSKFHNSAIVWPTDLKFCMEVKLEPTDKKL